MSVGSSKIMSKDYWIFRTLKMFIVEIHEVGDSGVHFLWWTKFFIAVIEMSRWLIIRSWAMTSGDNQERQTWRKLLRSYFLLDGMRIKADHSNGWTWEYECFWSYNWTRMLKLSEHRLVRRQLKWLKPKLLFKKNIGQQTSIARPVSTQTES